VLRTFTRIIAIVVAGLTPAIGAWAQPAELQPLEQPADPGGPTIYRAYGYDVRDRQKLREKARRTYWAEEAGKIARSGQNVVRDNEELYIYLDTPDVPRAIVLKSLWTFDPAATYSYQGYDDVGRFHIVHAGGSDYPTLLFISAKTGLIYEGPSVGSPVYSPDKSRFFSAGLGGMGCGEGFVVYRFDSGKVLLEARLAVGCGPCTYAWSGPNEVKADCSPSNGGRSEYLMTYRDGAWQQTTSP
jgi:hypothetical protein